MLRMCWELVLESWITWVTKSAGERPSFWRRSTQNWKTRGCFYIFIYVTFFCLWNPVWEALCSCHIMGFPVTRLSDAINLLLLQHSSGPLPIQQTVSFSLLPHLSLSEASSFQRAAALLESLFCKETRTMWGAGWGLSTCMVFLNIQEVWGLSMNKYTTAQSAF